MKRYFSLVPVISLFAASCRDEESASLENPQASPVTAVQVERVERRLIELENELLREKSARLEQEAEQTALLSEIKRMVETPPSIVVFPDEAKEEGRVGEALENPDLPVNKEEAQKMKLNDPEKREKVRSEAVGETYKSLETLSGVAYLEPEIMRVTDLGVVIRHQAGVARIPFSDLPKAWGVRFHHDPKRALKASREEQLAQARREKAVAQELAAMKEQAEQEAVDAQLALLADAVEDLRRRDDDRDADRFVVGGAFANPPIFAQNQFGFWDGFFCPPVVQPRVIHPPVVRNTHQPGAIIRNGNGSGVRLGSTGLQNPQIQRSPVTSRPRPGIQRVTPTVVRPSSRARSGSSAVSRPRTTVTPRTSTRTVRPSTSSRSSGAPRVIRRTR